MSDKNKNKTKKELIVEPEALREKVTKLKNAGFERKRAEEKTRRMTTVVMDSNDAITIQDFDGRITAWNKGAELMYGYSEKEAVQMNIGSLTPPDREAEQKEFTCRLIAGEEISSFETQRVTKDGRTLDIWMTVTKLTDDYGKPIGIASTERDITERKKSEELIKSILESVNEGFIIIDRDFRIILANRAFTEQVKIPFEGIIGKHCYEISHHYDKPCYEAGEDCAVKHVFETGEFNTVIHTHHDSQGTPFIIETKAYPLSKDESGKVTTVIEILIDITEKKKLEAQLLHAQKMEAVGTLAGGIAHDFNNILNVIMGYGNMVMDRMEADSLSKGQMNEVLKAAERAATLTKRLLVFSRKQVVEVKPVNINELILSLQKMLVRIIKESIDFNLELADSPLMVLADAGQIEQVLMNLASNAKDAMPEGGRLTIGTGIQEINDEYAAAYGYGKPGMYALITVADTGQGMDEETKEKIFEPFFTTKGIGEGTGLGLAISYGIIKQHNGYIKVYSETGKGTVFKIYLPLSEEATFLDKKTEAAVLAKGGNETILVAEDDASLRELARIILESFGYSVILAEDGEDAITKFTENRKNISLVLLDMIMPKKSGKEACEAIRKISPRTKILFLSGYTMDIIMTKELTEGGFNFIHKPMSPQNLLKKVREILDR